MADEGKGPVTAGGLLRAAREKHGLHIAALAAAMKVAPRKLDALENDRWSELPDATFVRALALTVCRTLKLDPRPVLELLPPAEIMALRSVGEHLNAPFHDTSVRGNASVAGQAVRPMVWAAGVLMAAALAVYFVPEAWFTSDAPAVAVLPAPASPASMTTVALPAMPGTAASAAPAAPAAPATSATSATVVLLEAASSPPPAGPPPSSAQAAAGETVFSAPPPGSVPAAAAGGAVQLRTSEPSWMDVRDGRGQVLLSRIVQPGESINLDGSAPIRLTVGNAAATQLSFRGQAVNLTASTRDNVARLELQ